MSKEELRHIDVLELLPQRPPFVMIDTLTHFDEVVTTTDFLIRIDNLFVEGDCLNSCALVENIAQTCAARIGYINHCVFKKQLKLGFIGSIKKLTIHRPVRVGELLQTRIEVVEEVMQLTLVNATIRVGDELVADCEMKIALSNINAE